MNALYIPKPNGLLLTTEHTQPINILTTYRQAMNDTIIKIQSLESSNELTNILNIFNISECIFFTHPAYTILFYELHELLSAFGIYKTNIQTICQVGISDNVMEQLFHSNPLIEVSNVLVDCDLLVMSCNNDEPIANILKTIKESLKSTGCLIIQLSALIDMDMVKILYIISMIFEKTHFVKPAISNVLSNKLFIVSTSYIETNEFELDKIDLNSIIVPPFFIGKIEEFISVNGHKQMDAYDQVLNCFFSKNKTVKLDSIKKNNFQKWTMWCDKYKIAYNKVDKTNVFLNAEDI
jgi:hypothetical protein